jgi:hypothetical protein
MANTMSLKNKSDVPTSIALMYLFSRVAFVISIVFAFIISSTLIFGVLGVDLPMVSNDLVIGKHAIFQTLPASKKVFILISSLLILTSIILCALYFKKFMQKIYEGEYFKRSTIKNLRNMSYMIFSVWLIKTISSLSLKLFWSVEDQITPIAKFHIADKFPSVSILLTALIFWTLSHVFFHGARIKEENDLTI